MKKSILMLGLAVAAMTSCTNDEVMEVNQNNLIKFESFVNKGTRTVVEVKKDSLKKFYVFGYHDGDQTPVFDNKYVEKNGNSWTNQESKDWRANKYYFGAYATKATSDKLTGASFSDNGTLTIANYDVTDSTDDLIAAVKTVDNTGLANEAVSLDFKHLLAQVKFEFANNNRGYLMTVSNITFKAMPKGTCTINNAGKINWNLEASDSLTYTYNGTSDGDYIAENQSFKSDSLLVLPVEIAATTCANFFIEFYEKVGDNYNKVQKIEYKNVSLIGTQESEGENVASWAPGYKYNYKAYFPINPSQIQFSVKSVEGWKDDTVDDNTTNNESVIF